MRLSVNTLFQRTLLFTNSIRGKSFMQSRNQHMSNSDLNISTLIFDNRNLKELPVDSDTNIYSRQVHNACFSLVEPAKVKNPILVAKSQPALDLLGLSPTVDDNILATYFGGNDIIPGSRPAAHCYCGHQFGSFAGQLGDGATMYLGEVIHPTTNERWELQLKGAGKTPYSRTADGRKVLRSSIREFLGSEGLYNLNIPTTRSGTCVTSDSTVERDPYYDGTVLNERCSIISRIAQNFFRFGSFEIFKSKSVSEDRVGPSAGNEALKKKLFDHVLSYYPHLVPTPAPSEMANTTSVSEEETGKYIAYFEEITKRTIALCVSWQCTGFVHGVLNTDNMSVMGLTLDYGPFGFIDHYDPHYVPNGSDGSGRYSYINQPSICKWNLMKFSEVLHPLLPRKRASDILSKYDEWYEAKYDLEMSKKFGFYDNSMQQQNGHSLPSGDKQFITDYFSVMTESSADFTDSFVALTEYIEDLHSANITPENAKENLVTKLVSRCATPANLVATMKRKMRIHRLSMHPQQIEYLWTALQASPEQVAKMFGNAPVDAIRNEIEGEKKKLDILVSAGNDIKKYENANVEQKRDKNRELWSVWVDKYHTRIMSEATNNNTSDSVLSLRLQVMRSVNPTFILRNWIAQDVIAAAEKKDFLPTRTVLRMLNTPFNADFSSFKHSDQTCSLSSTAAKTESTDDETRETDLREKYCAPPPEWSDGLLCTCSS